VGIILKLKADFAGSQDASYTTKDHSQQKSLTKELNRAETI
jgi:hypothetical protein